MYIFEGFAREGASNESGVFENGQIARQIPQIPCRFSNYQDLGKNQKTEYFIISTTNNNKSIQYT